MAPAELHPSAVVGLRFMTARAWDFPWRNIPSGLELVLLERGAAEWRVGRWRGTRRPGSVCAVEPGELSVGTRVLAPGSFFLVEIDPALLPGPGPTRARQYDDPAVTTAAARLAGMVRGDEEPLAVESALADLLPRLVPPRRSEAVAGAGSGVVRRLREVLDGRYRERLSLAEVSQAAGVSRFHAVRVFKDALGVTPFEYLMHVRLREAARALRAGGRPGAVAAALGFADQAHLSRWFTRMFRVAPAAYARAFAAGRRGAA